MKSAKNLSEVEREQLIRAAGTLVPELFWKDHSDAVRRLQVMSAKICQPHGETISSRLAGRLLREAMARLEARLLAEMASLSPDQRRAEYERILRCARDVRKECKNHNELELVRRLDALIESGESWLSEKEARNRVLNPGHVIGAI